MVDFFHSFYTFIADKLVFNYIMHTFVWEMHSQRSFVGLFVLVSYLLDGVVNCSNLLVFTGV